MWAHFRIQGSLPARLSRISGKRRIPKRSIKKRKPCPFANPPPAIVRLGGRRQPEKLAGSYVYRIADVPAGVRLLRASCRRSPGKPHIFELLLSWARRRFESLAPRFCPPDGSASVVFKISTAALDRLALLRYTPSRAAGRLYGSSPYGLPDDPLQRSRDTAISANGPALQREAKAQLRPDSVPYRRFRRACLCLR